MISRYQHGEFFSQDSIKHTGPAYHTSIGRKVYGGGGITPDLFVPEDTTNYTSYYKQATMSGLILQYAFNYTDNNRQKLKELKTVDALTSYLVKQNLVDKFATFADSHGLKRRNLMIQKSYKLIEQFIISRIVYNLLNEEAWTDYINRGDPTITKAIQVFKEGKSFPQKPVQKPSVMQPKK